MDLVGHNNKKTRTWEGDGGYVEEAGESRKEGMGMDMTKMNCISVLNIKYNYQ